ncbi:MULTISPECIES: hypothetical protein [Stenotrophomonas]|uniref:hypothetical protein n=1 Tax=Stenotrophomonas TaxID=40323 RepID=UPI0039C3F4F9
MRGLFPKKKSRLSPQGNAIAAAHVLLDSAEGRLDEKAAGRRLREEVCLMALPDLHPMPAGQEALVPIESLPKGWQDNGRTQVHLLGAAVMAAHTGGQPASGRQLAMRQLLAIAE